VKRHLLSLCLILLGVSAAKAQTGTQAMATVARLQTALDRNGFGVGLIDGKFGVRSRHALLDYARARHLSESAARAQLMDDPEPITVSYTVTTSEWNEVGAAPADWLEASAVPRMACTSLVEVLSERFHVSQPYLRRLNPEISEWTAALVGTAVTVPNTRPATWHPGVTSLEVDCRVLRLRAFDAAGALVGSFPCSVARDLSRVPTGQLRLSAFAPNPNYTFDPAVFPESPRAQAIGRKLIIPPGPNTPVGVYWIGLSAPGFGIHGTPRPETIGRQESHGCFRMTNWDIVTLAAMVTVGTPVTVTGLPEAGIVAGE
jgi:lipoprotein-anchoring transpeptidase ErfK/SrfK